VSPAPTVRRGAARRRYRLTSPVWCLPVLFYLGVFFVIPIGANFVRSATMGDAVANGALFYYEKLLTDAYYAGVLLETLKVSAIATVISLILGYPVAYFMVRHAGRWTGLLVFLVIAPLLTSVIMRTFGWRVLLARRGLITELLFNLGLISRPDNFADYSFAVYLGLVHVLVPFMVLSIIPVLQAIDVRLEESARALGAGWLRTMWSVTLPLSLDGIATGCILVFVLTNGSFLTMLLLGGGRVTTLALLIYQQFNTTQDIGFAAAMGNLLMMAALAGIFLQQRFLRRRGVRA
jgi:putative spermidine/putrescine transport system permease protein